MARVTVEDCIEQVSNRFDLVMLAAQRAREIAAGGALTVERDNDKNPVIALREIADVTVTPDALEQSLVQGLQKRVDFDEFEDDEEFDALEGEVPVPLQPSTEATAAAPAEAEAGPDGESEETASEPETDESGEAKAEE